MSTKIFELTSRPSASVLASQAAQQLTAEGGQPHVALCVFFALWLGHDRLCIAVSAVALQPLTSGHAQYINREQPSTMHSSSKPGFQL